MAAIQFAFTATENGYVGYREMDVFGYATHVPEPSTFLLAAFGLLALALSTRRRKK